MKKILVIAIVLLTGVGIAKDRTPYLTMVGCNGCRNYVGPIRWSITELVERYDGASSAPYADLKKMWDTAAVLHPFMQQNIGVYWSPHEVNLMTYGSGMSYAQRLLDSLTFWPYHYMKDYMDSVGADPEGMVMHIANTSWTLRDDYEVERTGYATSGIPKNRFVYQAWDNAVGDTFYPAGYVNLANPFNANAVKAQRYAARRYFLQMYSLPNYGPITAPWGMFFSDNSQGDAIAMGSYYTFVSATGPTYLTFTEQGDFRSDTGSAHWWRGVGHIFSEISREIGPKGGGTVRNWANSQVSYNPYSTAQLSMMIDSLDAISWEAGWEPDKNNASWKRFYDLYDTCRAHNKPNAVAQQAELFWNAYGASWFGGDRPRLYLGLYGQWLCARDSCSYYNAIRCHYDSLEWLPIYERNFGEYSAGYSIIATPTNTWVMMRPYDSGDVRVYARTGGNSVATSYYMTDYYTVTPGGTWYVMDDSTGVFGSTPVTTFTLRPCEAVIIANEPNWNGPHHSQPYAYNYVAPTIPHVQVWPSSITANGQVGGSNPSNQTLTVTNSGAGTMIWTASKSVGTWFTITPACDTGNGTVTVGFNISGLTAGTYSGIITIGCTTADNPVQYIPVSLTITGITSPHIVLSPTSLTFNVDEGFILSDTAKLAIINTGGGAMTWTVTRANYYLALNTYAGEEPESLQVAAIAFNLTAGTYYDTLTVTATGADNTPQICPVTITVKSTVPPDPDAKKKIRGLRRRP